METTKQILKSLTLLYAEDNDEIRETTLRTLRILFKDVYGAKDGAEALEIYNKNTINLLLLDYVMPNIDGYELAMEIRKTNRLIPIVICSGFTDKDKLMNAMKIGVIKYIEKPLKFDDLMNTMDDVAKMLKKENLLRIEILKNLSYDYINKNLLKDTTIILSLTKKEISLIEYLLKKRSMLCNYEELSYEIFGEEIDVNTLRNVVYRVQKKIELNFIIAVKELGYMIV